MRVASHIFVAALLRRAQAAGAFATVLRSGERSAGAVFVVSLFGRDATLYAPAPSDPDGARRHEPVLEDVDERAVAERLASEARFDPDHWVIEIEDRERRSFLDDPDAP